MDVQIEENGNSRLTVRVNETLVPGYEYEMLRCQKIPGLLPIEAGSFHGGTAYEYTAPGLTPLRDYRSDPALFSLLPAVLFSLEQLSVELEQYMLPPEELLLLPETVFLDRASGKALFLYLPGSRAVGRLGKSLRGVMEFFIQNTAHTDEAEMLLLYGLYQKSRETHLTLRTLAEYYREAQKKREQKQKSDVTNPYCRRPEQTAGRAGKKVRSVTISETDEEETQLISAEDIPVSPYRTENRAPQEEKKKLQSFFGKILEKIRNCVILSDKQEY